MIELADVFRRFAGDYLAAHGASMPPSHQRAITDILACRTEALGGHLWRCDQCSAERFSYHSLQEPELSQMPCGPDRTLAAGPPGRDAARPLLPRHRHRARGNSGTCCAPTSATAMPC